MRIPAGPRQFKPTMPLGLITELIGKPAVSAATGARCEINATAVINPIVAAHEVVNVARMQMSDLNKGIWIGRRSFRMGGGACIGGGPDRRRARKRREREREGRRRGGDGDSDDEGDDDKDEMTSRPKRAGKKGGGGEDDGDASVDGQEDEEGNAAEDDDSETIEDDKDGDDSDDDDDLKRQLVEGGAIVGIGPGLDYCHWSLALNGIIYEMIPKGDTIRCFVRDDDGKGDAVHKSKAEYTMVGKNLEVKESRESIESWMREYEKRNAKYHMTKNNCQKFVKELGKFATGTDKFEMHVQAAMGNLLW